MAQRGVEHAVSGVLVNDDDGIKNGWTARCEGTDCEETKSLQRTFLTAARTSGSAVTLHVCTVCKERNSGEEKFVATILGSFGDAAADTWRCAEEAAQRRRWEQDAQQCTRRRGCSAVHGRATWSMQSLGFGVLVDTGVDVSTKVDGRGSARVGLKAGHSVRCARACSACRARTGLYAMARDDSE